MDDERQLARRAAAYDREAFGRLYDLYADRIFRFIYYRIGDPVEAEDLAMDVFVKAWAAIERFEWRGGGFGAWLFRIARNLVVDHFRADEELSLEPWLLKGEWPDPERLMQEHEAIREVQQALAYLTDEQRETVILRFIEGLPSKEVAEILERSDEAVRALQYRALRTLRERLRAKQKA